MSRSPCAASLKNLLDIADFKSPRHKLSPSLVKTYSNWSVLNKLSPYNDPTKSRNQQLSPGPHFSSAPSSVSLQARNSLLSFDSPRRLLSFSKIKTTLNTANLLGRGRFGQVVLAKYKDEYAAVKIVSKPKQQFINEINAQHLSHPNIVRILKIEQIDDDVMIVMEPWGSMNLQQLLSISVNIPFEDIVSFSLQLASALEYCHSKGVLHLDVKPANVMIDSKRWIKLGDFGNSITVDQLNNGCTQRVGTVSYCAPEILRGEDPSYQSDVYSYGITLWQLEHNQIPFSDLSWPTIVYLVVAKNERPEIHEGLNEKERQLADLYVKCWSPKCEERPSLLEIIDSLNNL